MKVAPMADAKTTPKQDAAKTPAKTIESAGFFAFRTPLLPAHELTQWADGLEVPKLWQDPTKLEDAMTRDLALLRERLRALVARPDVREALFVASPDLEESLERWTKEPESEKGQRTEQALVRYFSRMAHRCTPFGLFAAHAAGAIGDKTRLSVVSQKEAVRHTRMDMDYLCGLVQALDRDPELRKNLTYRPNTSLYRASGRLRYAEMHAKSSGREYHLVAVEENDYLQATLKRAANGAKMMDLAKALVDDEITLEEAEGYLTELIDNQVLVSDLEPEVTGPEPIFELIRKLESASSTHEKGGHLAKTQAILEKLDREGIGHPPEHYRQLAKELETLDAKVDLSKLLQIDLAKPAPEATLSQDVIDELISVIDLLHKFQPRRGNDSFTAFKDAYSKRFETRWMPLVEVLDKESGIGFSGQQGSNIEGAPLLQGLAFPGGAGSENRAAWDRRDVYLYKELQKRLKPGELTLELSDEDVKALTEGNALPLADSISTMATLEAASEEALDAGDFRIYMHGAYGPSGARLLGRFCHNDARLQAYVEQQLRHEEALRPDAIFAEIAHLSQGRMGNVLARPVLREREIVFLGRSGAEEGKHIPATDIMVNVLGGRVVLRSKSMDKEIIPRLTSAANYSYRALDLYRFLASLQDQGTQGAAWSWGALEAEAFLPRLTRGRVVLARAQWNVEAKEIKAAIDGKGGERFKLVQLWRQERHLPRFVLLADGDNELPIDLENPLSLETFFSVIKKRGGFKLIEDYPGHDGLVAKGPEGSFTHELVIPLQRVKEEKKEEVVSPRHEPSLKEATVREYFTPGSEWLFAKIYCGQSTTDQLMREALEPMISSVLASGGADGWFFIRYSDPDPHLRLRFHGDPKRLAAEVVPKLDETLAPFHKDGWFWKLMFDTYERETDRYGGSEAIAIAEQLFQVDSDAVLKMVGAYPGDEGSNARWRLALRGMDQLLQDLGFDWEARVRIIQRGREDFGREFNVKGSALEHQLGDRFRQERKGLEALLDLSPETESPYQPGILALQARSAALAPIAAKLRALESEGKLNASLEIISTSLIHMFVNRAIRSGQRMHELVLYDFLNRIYESRLARAKKAKA
jgi:lantibiotic biosynthesis protein